MENNKNPNIRFKGFTDPWEQRKLEDIYSSIGNAFVGTATPYYVDNGHFYLESNNVKNGQINHNSEIFINDEFYEKQKDKWLHTGDMVMVQSGHVGHTAVITEELDNTAAHALIMFRNPIKEIEPYFFNYEYQTNKAKKKIENITTGNTIKHILASDMKKFVVDLPKYEEQKAIAEYFTNLDNLITLHQRKYDKLQNIKKSMLEKMFPKNGSNVPEIRFSGFTDPWEQRKLGELGEISTGSTPSTANSAYYSDDGMPWVTPTDINALTISDTPRKLSEEGAKVGRVVPANTILCTCIASIGKNTLLTAKGSFNQQINSLTPYDENDAYFLLTESEIWSNTMKRMAASGTMQIVNKAEFSELKTKVPSLAEQQQIGTYFKNLDNLITLHQRELEKLQNIKKSMLEKMFV